MENNMKIIGKFNKDKRYTIAEIDGELFALYNLNSKGISERKYECVEFAPGLYGIGPEIKDSLENKINAVAKTKERNPSKSMQHETVKTGGFGRE